MLAIHSEHSEKWISLLAKRVFTSNFLCSCSNDCQPHCEEIKRLSIDSPRNFDQVDFESVSTKQQYRKQP